MEQIKLKQSKMQIQYNLTTYKYIHSLEPLDSSSVNMVSFKFGIMVYLGGFFQFMLEVLRKALIFTKLNKKYIIKLKKSISFDFST